MKDSTLLKIALISALIGLITLSVITTYLEPNLFGKKKSSLDGIVKLKGKVSDVKQGKNYLLLDVLEEKNTKAIIYEPKRFNITKGTEVEIFGKIDNGVVIVDKIRVID